MSVFSNCDLKTLEMGTGERIATPVCALARNDKLGTLSAVGDGFPVPPFLRGPKKEGTSIMVGNLFLIPYSLFLITYYLFLIAVSFSSQQIIPVLPGHTAENMI